MRTSNAWKGDKAGYVAKHMWIINHYGNATHCRNDPAHKARRYHWANISGEYRRDITDFMPLCPSCHKLMDSRKSTHCKHGHLWTEESTYIDPRGFRNCRICIKDAQARHADRLKRHIKLEVKP